MDFHLTGGPAPAALSAALKPHSPAWLLLLEYLEVRPLERLLSTFLNLYPIITFLMGRLQSPFSSSPPTTNPRSRFSPSIPAPQLQQRKPERTGSGSGKCPLDGRID